MSWNKSDTETETVYLSKADDSSGVCDDLAIVIERMKENKESDEAGIETNILLYWNATNGYVKIMWFDPNTNKSFGNLIYFLELPELHATSLTHEDGASHFDNTVYLGTCCLLEEVSDIIVYTLDESGRDPELLTI